MPLTPGEERDLVPELSQWNEGRGIALDDWAVCTATPLGLIGASRIFWPEFLLRDDCVLLAHGWDEGVYRQWLESTRGDKRAVESVMNHVHVTDLFGDPELEPSGAQVDYLGETLVSMWKAKLAIDFPGRTFEVIYDGPDGQDLNECEVTFRQAVREQQDRRA